MKHKWKFEVKEEKFYINGEQCALLCGEIQYFRMPKEHWGETLDRLVEAGCNAVAYYVPWFVHEYEEGKFDFHGKICPENDLHTWIQMTMDRGLLAYFRPGPYVYAETTDLGIPRWFTKKYRDVLVKRYQNGEYRDTEFANSVAHNHPDFLQAVERWYEAVCNEIKDYQVPKGNIVMFQLCNEIPGDDHDDENPCVLGIGNEEGIWPQYLKHTYGKLEKLNARYHTEFTSWETVMPYVLKTADAEAYVYDQLGYYYKTYYPLYFKRLREIADRCGILVQLTHNAYNPRAVSLHYQNKEQNPWLLIGLDCYYSLSGRLGMKEATYYCEFGAEYARRFLHNTPWVIEQESGYWNDFPSVYGPELYIWNIWTMACGYQGMNMYMFAGGKNRPGMGFYGTEHNWQAPVDYCGRCTENYEYVKQSISDIRENEAIFLEDMRYDIGFGIKHAPGLIWKPVARVTSDTYFVLKEAGFTPRIYDFEAMTAEELAKCPILWIVCDEYMDEKVQIELCIYVKNGGKLILNGRVPDRTEQGERCTILADFIGMQVEREPFREAFQKKILWKDIEYFIGKNIQRLYTERLDVLAYDEEENPAVWHGMLGRGEILILPFALEMQFYGLANLVKMLLAEVQAVPIVKCAGKLRVIPKKSDNNIVMNLHPMKVTEKIVCRTNSGEKEWNVTLEPHSFEILK